MCRGGGVSPTQLLRYREFTQPVGLELAIIVGGGLKHTYKHVEGMFPTRSKTGNRQTSDKASNRQQPCADRTLLQRAEANVSDRKWTDLHQRSASINSPQTDAVSHRHPKV